MISYRIMPMRQVVMETRFLAHARSAEYTRVQCPACTQIAAASCVGDDAMVPAPPPFYLIEHAIKLLLSRPHTRYELVTKLERLCNRRKTSKRPATAAAAAGVNCGEAVEGVMEVISKQGLVDDAGYASWHVESRAAHRARSRLQLITELRQKHVPGESIEAALDTHNELAACLAAARKRTRLPEVERMTYLARKGFPYHIIKQAITQQKMEAEEAAENDAELR